MADNKMLIDASHPEETRVVVLRDGRVEEFDYESAARKLLRGSIFLSKITRVEPSLQAAFVDYGGNRHGFLAFNEIHPDYYQIPHADRLALLEAEFGVQNHDDDDDDGDHADASIAEAEDVADDETELASDEVEGSSQDNAEPEAAALGEPDFEAEAIDVTQLLPPEPSEVVVTDEQSSDAADEPEDSRVAAADTEATATHEETVEAESSEQTETEEPKGPPKTIAAATPPDDRIVSEPVDEGSSIDTAEAEIVDHADEAEAATESEETSQPVEKLSDTLESISASGSELPEAAESEPATASAEQAEAENLAHSDDDADEDGAAASELSEAEARSDENDPPAHDDDDGDDDAIIDDVGDSDALEEVPTRARRRVRNYKIQEVIKRRQIVLVQVVKEERGNKGAALTTYLSLAGRYTVLMPNTARGGGISRKITNIQDRKRLKAIAQELDVPEGMGLIIRTAGAARTKQEIKRDFEYLLRLWESVRDLTLRSTAPSLVYEEGDLIKRSIRDLYSRDVEQVLVSGEVAYKEAKGFMRMLMPSHAKNVVRYDDAQPLFTRYRIEQQLNAMFSPFVQLKSGGYLVINQTEALVAVDVNSGKSTRKFSIEDTALNTNLEAAEELTRQLKLRDLAGLIVIDFIDMEEKRNNRAVERRLKECLRDDRARIQVGRISHFGLLEMSRQRLRTGVLEGSTMPCQHCQGTGIIRSTESVALAVLRGLEDQLMTGQPRSLTAQCSRDAAMYLLNQKREFVQEIEARYGVSVHIEASDGHQGADFVIQRRNGGGGSNLPRRVDRSAVNVEAGFSDDGEERARTSETDSNESDERRPRRRRRRRGRRGEADTANDQVEATTEASEDSDNQVASGETEDNDTEQGERQSRRRRRGRRGGRNSRGQKRSSEDNVAAPGAPQPTIGEAESDDWGDGPSQEQSASELDGAVEDTHVGDEAVAESISGEPTPAVASAEVPDSGDSADDIKTAALSDSLTNEGNGDEVETAATAVNDAPDTDVEDEPSAVDGPANGAVTNGVSAEVVMDAEEIAPSPRGEPESSEPVLERIVMTPENDGSVASEANQDVKERPARKGWWQRNFGA